MVRPARTAAALLGALLAVSCSSSPKVVAGGAATTVFGSALPASTTSTTLAPITAATPCAGRPGVATYAHVLVIVMENHGYADVAAHSPYLDKLAAACGLATDSHGVAHPSLPNYLALTSGGTQGVTDDCTGCSTGATSIFQQVGDKGWKAYEEDLPAAGFTGATAGNYAKKHNPAAYFTAVKAAYATQAVPLGTLAAGALADDLAHDTLPQFAFVTPNLCHDGHDCPLATGDAWLAGWVPKILASPAYQAGRTALFVTYDEDDNTAANHIYTVVAAPAVPAGTSVSTTLDHYSLLATVEDLLGLGRLGNAAAATSMRAAFHL